MKAQHKSTRQRVKNLMFIDQLYRDSDKHLWLKIAEQDGFILTKGQRAIFLDLPSQEIVARRRREFSRIYPASPLVDKRRYHAFREMSDEFSKQNWLVKVLKRRRIV